MSVAFKGSLKRLFHVVAYASMLALAALLAAYGPSMQAQQPLHEEIAMQATTDERLATESWWPRMDRFPLQAFAGSASCTGCHKDVAGSYASAMKHASEPAKDATFLRGDGSGLSLRRDSLSYFLKASASGMDYSAMDKGHAVSHPLDWVMGAGELGRTFLYQDGGRWFQSEVSLYTNPGELDTTTGLSKSGGMDLSAALGQVLTPDATRQCFSCHTVHATTSAGFNPLHAEAGLGCESCHGPGRAHVEQMSEASSNGKAVTARRSASAMDSGLGIFDPSDLSPVNAIDFCGSCHRTFADVTVSLGQGAGNAMVRFQPYRLQKSNCWRATQDTRLTCTACHDPHQALDRNAVSYNKYCVLCHSSVGAQAAQAHAGNASPNSDGACVTCHMPKVTVASMHGEFTDHWIRVVRTGEGFIQ